MAGIHKPEKAPLPLPPDNLALLKFNFQTDRAYSIDFEGSIHMKAIRVLNYGSPEVLGYEDIAIPEPKAGEARLKIAAIGVNFIDIYQRTGLYPLQAPFTLGMEGAGVVDAIGEDVTEVTVGDRVAYAMVLGSYAEYAIVPAAKLAPLPANVDTKSAAALMLQGMTAHYLTHSTYQLKKGDTALIHAAAGGVGLVANSDRQNARRTYNRHSGN
jgi:NADPH2:quinone reductase